jgi:hypothetical protein
MIILLSVISFIAALLIIIAIFGMTQPRTATLERSIVINADAPTVFAQLASLRNFVTWNPWTKKDPNIQQTFAGEDGTVGSSYSWKGNRAVGEGTMTITGIEPYGLVTMTMDFGQRGNAKAAFVAEELEGKTKVTWKFESEMGNALRRGLMTRMMQHFVGRDYEQGLKNLKAKIEA